MTAYQSGVSVMGQTLSARPISADESAQRRRAVEEARAANYRQGYVHDPVLEEANERYIRGVISLEDLRREMRDAIRAGR
jgi:hypothetical protein